jgi:hypothetical protein
MNEIRLQEKPFSTQIDAVSYFLLGLFAVQLYLRLSENSIELKSEIANIIVLVLGSILIAVSFLNLLSTFKFIEKFIQSIDNCLKKNSKLKKLRDKVEVLGQEKRVVLFLVFAFTYLEVFVDLLDSFSDPFPDIIRFIFIIFCFLLPLSTIYSFISTSSVKQMLSVIASLTILALYIVFTGDFSLVIFNIGNVQVFEIQLRIVVMLVLILIFVFSAIDLYSKQKKINEAKQID